MGLVLYAESFCIQVNTINTDKSICFLSVFNIQQLSQQ